MTTDKNKYLDDVLTSHKISKEQKLLDKHIGKRDDVIKELQDKYGANVYSPFNSGSYPKNTAVNKKFDFDLMTPFKRNAFDTLEKMYNDVYEFLYDKYKSKATVRRQKVSIGLEFYADADGDVIKIDVVPGRELTKDQYEDDNKLNLYVYTQFGKLVAGSDYLRTNPKAQIENIRSNAERGSVRQIIRLLKVWKIYNHKQVKSFFIELITIKAFDQKDILGGLWDKLKAVMEYIRDNVMAISLPDPGNSGNDVAETMTDFEKGVLSDDMRYMIERIEENSDNIKSYFKINDKFPPDENKEENRYGEKKPGVTVPPATRFG